MSQNKIPQKALVVLSGGQDSITCLGYALAMFQEVHAISFVYGQRHKVEMLCAEKVCLAFQVPHKVVDLGLALSGLVDSALTGPGKFAVPHASKPGLPSSFVPGRNALFLTLAHAYAQTIGAKAIITGVCQTDYSGYPDCRERFIAQLSVALNSGYETPGLVILTPLMHLTKAETFMLADELGWLEIVLKDSHTCYEGDHSTEHEWGFGCGECPACKLRAKGWEEYQAIKAKGGYKILREDLAGSPQTGIYSHDFLFQNLHRLPFRASPAIAPGSLPPDSRPQLVL